jgi:hypothetical protein
MAINRQQLSAVNLQFRTGLSDDSRGKAVRGTRSRRTCQTRNAQRAPTPRPTDCHRGHQVSSGPQPLPDSVASSAMARQLRKVRVLSPATRRTRRPWP